MDKESHAGAVTAMRQLADAANRLADAIERNAPAEEGMPLVADVCTKAATVLAGALAAQHDVDTEIEALMRSESGKVH